MIPDNSMQATGKKPPAPDAACQALGGLLKH